MLFTGGSTSRNAEIFDPATNRFTRAKGRLGFARWRHGANLLPSGRVVVSDGGSQAGELYDPATETFSPVPGGDSMSRYAAQYLPFRTDEVLILGGFAFLPDGNILLHANMDQYMESYGPYGSYFGVMTLPPNGVYLGDARAYSSSSLLADGRWLVTGGLGPAFDQPDLSSALLFDPSAE